MLGVGVVANARGRVLLDPRSSLASDSAETVAYFTVPQLCGNYTVDDQMRGRS